MQNIKNKILKFTIYIIGSFMTFIAFPLITFAWGSGTNYFWAVKAMFDSGTVQGDIIEDESNSKWDEIEYMCYHEKGYNGSDTNAFSGGTGSTGGNTYYPLDWSTGEISSGTKCIDNLNNPFVMNSPKPLSFPGIEGYDAKADDNHKNYATKLNSVLTNSFNAGLSMFANSKGEYLTQQNLNSKEGKLLFLKAIAALGSNSQISENMSEDTITIENNIEPKFPYSIKVSGISDTEAREIIDRQANFLKGIGIKTDEATVKKYFLKVKPGTEGKYTILQWAYPKGYGDGESLENKTVSASEQYVPTLSWMHVSLSALSLYTQGIYSSSSGDLYSAQGTLTSAIVDFLSGIVTGILSLFGADTIDDLIFSTGGRSDYYFGIAPESWFTNLSIILIISYVVAITILGIAFIKNFTMGNISILNPAAKANVMNGLMNVLYSILGLTIYIPVIGLLFALNRYIVQFAYGMSNGVTFMSSLISPGADIGGIISAFILLFLMIRINILYIIRSLYIVALYCLGPLFIAGAGFGNKKKSLFTNWAKEFIGQLFLQSFHAIVLLIFIKMGVTNGILTKCVLAYSFIPLAKLFREKLLQLGGADGDNYKGGKFGKALGGALATGAGAVAAGALSGGATASGGKGGKGKEVPPTAFESAQNSVQGINNTAENMKDNDKNNKTGEKDYSAGSVAGKSAMGGFGNIARGLGTLAVGAAVQAAGGNNKELLRQGGNLMSAGVGGITGSMAGLRNFNKNKSQIESNCGLTDSAVKTINGTNGQEQEFRGTYNSDDLGSQTYFNDKDEEKDMHTSWDYGYDSKGNIDETLMPSFVADLDAINADGDKSNPLYGVAQHCAINQDYSSENVSKYFEDNGIKSVTAPRRNGIDGKDLSNSHKVALNFKAPQDSGISISQGSKEVRVSQKIVDGNINVEKANNLLANRFKK